MSRLLLLEDDLSLIDGLAYSLKKQDYDTDIARTIKEALVFFAKHEYDLLLLDLTLPDGSGFDFCKTVRATSKVPVIFLTASDEEVNMIMGLDIGGDDYITKPFKLGVLVSRINALLRRVQEYGSSNMELESGCIRIQRLEGIAYMNGEVLELTSAEYKLLCFFMQNKGLILSKEKIMEKLWDCDENYIDDNTLAVYIHRLRVKIEANPATPRFLLTVRGLGYKWEDSEFKGIL